MKKYLNQISEIRSGYLFKSGIRTEPEGSISVIQLKDVDERGNINFSAISKISLENISSQDFLMPDDVLFKAKTNRPTAAAVSRKLESTIATAHYFIIRLNTVDVLPGYLAWYLNQRPAQIYFSKHAGGTRIQVITKQVLGNLEVVIPAKSIQEKVEKIYRLHFQERQLVDALKEKKHELISAQLMNVIHR